jgi:hypothetical protein
MCVHCRARYPPFERLHLTLPYPTLPYLTLHYLILSYPILSYPTLPSGSLFTSSLCPGCDHSTVSAAQILRKLLRRALPLPLPVPGILIIESQVPLPLSLPFLLCLSLSLSVSLSQTLISITAKRMERGGFLHSSSCCPFSVPGDPSP